jgi:ankyrin repeat protein
MQDKEGNTPILFAAYKGQINLISKMIELGANYNAKNKAGLNVIHMAAQNDMANVIIYFKEKYNFNLYQKDNQGNNPIHWASSNSAKIALDYLLFYLDEKNKDNINDVNKNGQTALHLAILTSGSTEIIKRLIKKGIKINNKDNNDMTALDITKDNLKYENINKLIIDYTKTNCL